MSNIHLEPINYKFPLKIIFSCTFRLLRNTVLQKRSLTPFLNINVPVTSGLVNLSYVTKMFHRIINSPLNVNEAKKLMCRRILCCFLRVLQNLNMT